MASMNAMRSSKISAADSIVACHRHAQRHAFSCGRVPTNKRQSQQLQHIRLSRQRGHTSVSAAAATDIGTRAVQSIKKSVGGDVFVAGGNGQLSARIIQELLRNGYKVTAGVADVEEAQAGLDFAKRFEIIKGSEVKNIRLQAVDLSDESAIADALPRSARVLVAVGDSLGSQRDDNQLLDRALSAAKSKGAQQFILVTPLGGGGGLGGLFGSLFGGGGGSSKQPSKIERQVAESGLDFVIIRTAKTDGAEPSLGECGVSVTPQGSLTANSKATKSQVAEVVAQVLLQAQTDVLVEVAADPDTPPQSVDSAVAQVLSDCSISEAAQENDAGEEQQQEVSPGKGLGGIFGRTQSVKAQPQQPQDDRQGSSQQSGGLSGLFGGRSKSAADAPTGPQKQKKIDAKLVDAKPVGKERGGFKQLRGGNRQETDEEKEDSTSQNPFASLFGGAKKAKAEAQQATASAEGARKSAAKGAAGKVRQGKSAAEQAASTNGAAPKKKGGFLSALGLGQESVYADEEN